MHLVQDASDLMALPALGVALWLGWRRAAHYGQVTGVGFSGTQLFVVELQSEPGLHESAPAGSQAVPSTARV